MKIMKIKLKRKHWVIVAASSVIVMLYFGMYLHYRVSHTFIHRAGNYAADISRGRPRFSTTHFIEPSDIVDGPQIFAEVVFAATAISETNDLSGAEIETMLHGAAQHMDTLQKKKDRFFLLFEPAAFLEILVWKIVDPNPLDRRHKRQNKSVDHISGSR